jgi:type II secretory pathway pseudopilin PulG
MNTHSIDCWVKAAQIAQGFSTPVIAILLGIVTILVQRRQAKTQERQAKTLRLQHRLALLDRRMKVFNATQGFIALVLQEARINNLEPLFKLTRDTREHHFLFGAEIGEYIDELYSKGNKLRQIYAATRGTDVLRPEDIEPEAEINRWFSGQIGVAEQKFLKYIDFREP